MRKLNRPVESGSLIIAIKSKGRNITLINNNKDETKHHIISVCPEVLQEH